MSVTVTCECTNTFSLKDEFAGRVVKCPNCGRSVARGDTTFTPESQADPVFGRDVFLLRQQALRINERYNVPIRAASRFSSSSGRRTSSATSARCSPPSRSRWCG
jgi:hypothetical protein